MDAIVIKVNFGLLNFSLDLISDICPIWRSRVKQLLALANQAFYFGGHPWFVIFVESNRLNREMAVNRWVQLAIETVTFLVDIVHI